MPNIEAIVREINRDLVPKAVKDSFISLSIFWRAVFISYHGRANLISTLSVIS